MNTMKITTRAAGVAVALAAVATCAIGPVGADPAPAPKPAPPKPATVTATCSSANPMFVVGNDMLSWKVTAKAGAPGQVLFSAVGGAGGRDFVLNQFSSKATVSWNNTTTGKFGSAKLAGNGAVPTLNQTAVTTGKGAVTFNIVIKAGAGTEWIGTQTSSPCVGTITV